MPQLDDTAAVEAGLDALDAPPEDHGQSLARRLAWAVLPPVGFLALVIAIWQALWASAIWTEYELPAPLAVWNELAAQFSTGAAFGIIWTSVYRAVIGFLVAIVIATPLGLLVAKVRVVRAGIGPFLSGLQSLPSVAWVPAAILWF